MSRTKIVVITLAVIMVVSLISMSILYGDNDTYYPMPTGSTRTDTPPDSHNVYHYGYNPYTHTFDYHWGYIP